MSQYGYAMSNYDYNRAFEAQAEAEAEDMQREAQAARRHRARYACGGWSSYDGPCGATDCDDCHPGGADF